MVNIERIKQKLEKFVRSEPVTCEMCGELPCECDLRQRSFWGGQDIAEEEERKMIDGPYDEIKGSPELQEWFHDETAEACVREILDE